MNNLEFQKLLFNTMISSKDSNEESTYKLKKIIRRLRGRK